MVLNPLVPLLPGPVVVIDVLVGIDGDLVPFAVEVILPEKGERRGNLHRGGDVRAHTREYLLVRGVSGQGHRVAYVVGYAVIDDEVSGVPVVQTVGLPAELVVQDEVVIGPLESLTEAGRQSEHFHLPVVAQYVPGEVRVGLTGVVGGEAQARRLLSEEPGLHEGSGQCRIVCSGCLEAERKVLGVTERYRPPCGLVQEAPGGKVVERDSDGGDEGAASPTSGQLQLAGRLLRHIVYDVDGVVVPVRDDRVTAFTGYGLRVELTQRSDFPDGALEVSLGEQVAGTGEYLAADHPFVSEVIAVDDDVVQRRLLPFHDPHFHINRVPLDIHFHGLDIEEEVTVVAVQFGDVHVPLLASSQESFLHGDHVIDVTFLYLENLVEVFRRIHGVARPGNVPEIVPWTFLDVEVDGKFPRLYSIYGIRQYPRITESRLIECGYEVLLVVGIFLLVEFLGGEEVVYLIGFGLLHGLGHLPLGDMLGPVEIDVLDLYLGSPVHIEIYPDCILDDGVLGDLGRDLDIPEALLAVVPGDDVAGGLVDILGELASPPEGNPLLEVLPLTALHTGESVTGHPWTLLDTDDEPCAVALGTERVKFHFDILEIPLGPQAVHDGGDVVPGDGHFHSLVQTGQIRYLGIRKICVSLDPDSPDNVFLGTGIINGYVLSLHPQGAKQQNGQDHYPISSHAK